jgi:hypothetical protein
MGSSLTDHSANFNMYCRNPSVYPSYWFEQCVGNLDIESDNRPAKRLHQFNRRQAKCMSDVGNQEAVKI